MPESEKTSLIGINLVNSKWRIATLGMITLCLFLVGAFVFLYYSRYSTSETYGKAECLSTDVGVSRNVFSELSPEESKAVSDYLYDQTHLSLGRPGNATIVSNFIYMIDSKIPPKESVLKYLDHGDIEPAREATVYLFRGAEHPPVVEEYLVGPLPKITYMTLVNTTARRNSVPYTIKPFTKYELEAVNMKIYPEIDRKCRDIFIESFGATLLNCSNKCLKPMLSTISTGFIGEDKRQIWMWFAYAVDYYPLHPVDFQFLVDISSHDINKWLITQVWYANKLFPDIDEFVKMYKHGNINKTKLHYPIDDDHLYSSLHIKEPTFPKDNKRGPKVYEPDGHRYTIAGNQVNYMLWRFNYKVSALVGLRLFDLRFHNERIAYEISLQDIAVMYSGNSPAARVMNYADSAGLLGTRSRGLAPGIDCPEHATFLPASIYSVHQNPLAPYENALCIFEHVNSLPLRRHRAYHMTGPFYGGLSDNILIIRSVITLMNYDYICDYIFHANGGVEIRVASTGYVSATFYNPGEELFGSQLRKNMFAGLHNHLFHYKIDLDIKGTKNRFQTLDIQVRNDTNEHSPNGNFHSQPYLVKNVKKTELHGAYKFNFDTPKYLLFGNEQAKNKQGQTSAYRLLVSGMTKVVAPEGFGFESSVSWSRHQVAVTRHKDDEETSSSVFAMWDAANPVVNFQKYLDDDESIVDQVNVCMLIN